MTIVMKFGGTSVGSGERIAAAAKIITQYAQADPVVVTSAMSGVTNTLLELAGSIAQNDSAARDTILKHLIEKHRVAAQHINAKDNWEHLEQILQNFEVFIRGLTPADAAEPKGIDSIASWGERLTVPLVAGAVAARGYAVAPAVTPLIGTDETFGDATPDAEKTQRIATEALQNAKKINAILIAPGYIGVSPNNHITTLGRGGSDYAATLIAAALNANACWIYTDVNGVFTADPRIAPQARALPIITYGAAGRLAVSGAKVLHQRSVAPAARTGMELRVLNSFEPEHPGTIITREAKKIKGLPLAVVGRENVAIIRLVGSGVAETPKVFERMIIALAKASVAIEMTIAPIPRHDPEVVIDMRQSSLAAEALMKEFAIEYDSGLLDSVLVDNDVSLCIVVGSSLGSSAIRSARKALESAYINPINEAYASDAVTYLLRRKDMLPAILCLHQQCILPAVNARMPIGRPYKSGQWAAGGKAARQRTLQSAH